MATVLTAYTSKAMGKVAALKIFFYNLGNNRPPKTILPFITLIIELDELLQVIGDALIKWHFLRGAGQVYARLFYHLPKDKKKSLKENLQMRTTYVTLLR